MEASRKGAKQNGKLRHAGEKERREPYFFFRMRSFISWWLNAVDEHSLHSPFFFDFYTRQIKARASQGEFRHIESYRRKFLGDHRILPLNDLGAGAHQKPRKISTVARTSLSAERFSALYLRIANYFNASSIIELGTALGINTLYLAEKEDANVTTFEGSPALADLAGATFASADKKNVSIIVGNIDQTLPDFLQQIRRLDFAFMDANHRYDPTVRYFEWLLRKMHERSVLIIDDIHYSPEMEAAWTYVKRHRLVYGSADLFRCGIVFFDPSLNKQHVILQV